eukprot:3536161-Ditylum_brightwellii.AAC.1
MADENDKGVKLVRLLTFNGEQKNFQIWWMQFRTFGVVYGFGQSIKQERDSDLPSTEDKSWIKLLEMGERQLRHLN